MARLTVFCDALLRCNHSEVDELDFAFSQIDYRLARNSQSILLNETSGS